MTLVMGVVNVTPDSFSDGGLWLECDAAVTHALELVAQGARIVDVGGESTRPGAQRVSAAEEIGRVVPVIARLRDQVTLSVDTMRAQTAVAACAAGATLVNDVSGGMADPAMFETVAELGTDYVLQHWRGPSAVMDEMANYDDVAAEVLGETLARRDAAVAAGIAPERIILDPGLGFAKSPEHNWALLADLPRWQATGHRVLIGASRKRFLAPARDRDAATAAVTAWCAAHGVWAVRTHEVSAQLDAAFVGGELARHLSTAGRLG
ncbi:dihydropteroate synthase [Tessaracoccus sp. OH4464_COT-324]|uniref:dihydropteroate synthase n=1 Tax=Tessaracoccus sp. OH4464_COT-324 TaxID=2491059 RepID=UPI001F39FAAB|nr:dihydropteroate synthase [Tessaracoccus sp. OH4464_COT-324]